MSTDDKTPPFPPDAFIDKNTGMYTFKESSPNHSAFEQRDDGMWVPRPKHKPHRRMLFGMDGYHDCIETMEQVKLAYDTARKDTDERVPWYAFIEPIYGTVYAIPRDKMLKLQGVSEAWTDIDGVKDQIAQHEAMVRMQRIQAGKKN